MRCFEQVTQKRDGDNTSQPRNQKGGSETKLGAVKPLDFVQRSAVCAPILSVFFLLFVPNFLRWKTINPAGCKTYLEQLRLRTVAMKEPIWLPSGVAHTVGRKVFERCERNHSPPHAFSGVRHGAPVQSYGMLFPSACTLPGLPTGTASL